MSGILGIYHLDGCPVEEKYLQQMVDILAHRGPDGADIWVDGGVGLGHRMLWTTPESLIEKLPGTNQTGDLIITADARIDNREELLEKLYNLYFPEYSVDKITDSQIILAAYEQWGEHCPEYLLGDFAFAIWDKRQQILFCARDHFGVKPFYYHHQPGKSFVFASEIKALFCLPYVPRRLDEVRLGDYLSFMMEDKIITSYTNILRLPPAHSMVISSQGIQSWCYWILDIQKEIKLKSDEEYADEFCKIFTESVRCRLRSAFPVASHLSGGLDSSSVTCMARHLLSSDSQKLHSISLVFDEVTECDERDYIHKVLEQGGITPHFLHGDRFGPLSDIDKIWKHEDEALLGPSHFYPWRLNRKAQEIGARVCLDGFDGDSTVSHGVYRLRELAVQEKWETFAQEVVAVSPELRSSPRTLALGYASCYLVQLVKQFRWIRFFKAINQLHKYLGFSRKYLVHNYFFWELIPQQIWQWWFTRGKPQNSLKSLIKSSFAKEIHLQKRINNLGINKPMMTDREYQWRSMTTGLRVYSLEQSDRYAAAFSLESRHPFMDKRLIEFCLALPAEQKLYQGWTRMVMRRAMTKILPEAIQWRVGKANAQGNFRHGLLKIDRHILEDIIINQLKIIQPYVNVDMLKENFSCLTSESKEQDINIITIWQVIILAAWLHREKKCHQ
ncbi:lasso peptide isopeptide bond-forming cyclase [Calothrix sp. 336/3]|uniref:lasso peptide isopeptide bond-forming cyclase n=1 Tax=Calothrix sp. 336/3 TaxID=1337936 RepID=UPI0004E4224A|nr:lasso peptide isopeptide bond-forming cyclase [Calothrix sp. 336/3]AKG20938.1 asparagine synthase [Calothrix sp. 336/3]